MAGVHHQEAGGRGQEAGGRGWDHQEQVEPGQPHQLHQMAGGRGQPRQEAGQQHHEGRARRSDSLEAGQSVDHRLEVDLGVGGYLEADL